MPDDTTTGGTPGPGGTPGQAGQAQGSQTNATGGTPGTDGTSGRADDYAELKAAIAKEREQRETAERALKDLREKDLPEAEKRVRRISELEAAEQHWNAERQDLRIEVEAVRVAGKLGYADADDALGWLTRHRDQVEFDDKGNPTNLSHLLRELLKSKPHYLAETTRPRGSAEGGARGQGAPVDFNAALRRSAGRG